MLNRAAAPGGRGPGYSGDARVRGRLFPALAALILALTPATALAWDGDALCALRHTPDLSTANAPAVDACLEPSPSGEIDLAPIPWTKPVTVATAREAYHRAHALSARGALADALLQLHVVEHALPRIADRIALERAELLMGLGQPAPACDAYRAAAESPDRNVAVRGQVGHVRCLIAADDPDAERSLERLQWRYPELAERDALRVELAGHRKRTGRPNGAAALLRAVDLSAPTSPAAELARNELETLRAEGAFVRPLTRLEQVDRAERVVRSGAPSLGRETVAALLAQRGFSPELQARIHLLQARVARVEGRWNDVTAALALATKLGADPVEVDKLSAPVPSTRDSEAAEAQRRWAKKRIDRLVAGRDLMKLNYPQLRRIAALAAQHELADEANGAMAAIGARSGMMAGARFEVAMLTAGLVDPEHTAAVLEPTIDVHAFRVSGRYHYARALEQAGRRGEAEVQYLQVIELDTSLTRYYAMWADQRLWALHNEALAACTQRPDGEARATGAHTEAPVACDAEKPSVAHPTLEAMLNDPAPAPIGDGAWPLPEPPVEASDDPGAFRTAALDALRPLADRHGEAYPWLLRARDLVLLDRYDDAADELNETYLAYRDAHGSPRLRSGLHAMYTGSAPARRPMDWELKRARKEMAAPDRQRLAEIAAWLGDPGVSLRFKGFHPTIRPRAYADEVQAAAREYDIDPNLLFAVMRVESIYNRRIISYAGAVGLMQIMPRTGRLIAEHLGKTDFQVTDLLDPHTNLRFAAWYLSSLLRRFDGRLPLAIASYNGGPHNVRLWMRSHNPRMPLDAFLERIPFSQTHRYVRRVLTHYAAYRAQHDLPMTPLSVQLPEEKPDALAF